MHQLRYTLQLRRPAVIAAQAENPNMVTSLGYIPGAAVLGAAAAAFIANPTNNILAGKAHEDKTFMKWFLRGHLTFLNAYPTDSDGKRLLPTPLSVMTDKAEDGTVYDLSDHVRLESAQREGIRLVPASGFANFEGDVVNVGEPKKRLRYHHARPNRLRGRPVENDGSIFVYEALESGQVLAGRILGEVTALKDLLLRSRWASGEITIRLGRSRTAEYGGDAILQLGNSEPEEFTREPSGSNAALTEHSCPLVVTLLSPLIGRDANGGQAAFPMNELAAALTGSGLVPSDILAAYCRHVWVGGYSGIWNLPRQQAPAFAGGSVFVVNTTGVAKPSFNASQAECCSLGERTGEGYGRFAINWHSSAEIKQKDQCELWTVTIKMVGTPPEGLLRIYRESRRRLLLDAARSAGVTAGSEFSPLGPDAGVATSQLGRVIQTLRNDAGLAGLSELLASLRGPAEKQLRASSHLGKTLLDVLTQCTGTPNSIRTKINVPAPTGIEGLPDDDAIGVTANVLARVYLLSMCTQMARRKRAERPPGGAIDEV